MTPERWAAVERLYHAARERPASDRGAFLAEACAGDAELRREVESLLAQPVSDDKLFVGPSLSSGATVHGIRLSPDWERR